VPTLATDPPEPLLPQFFYATRSEQNNLNLYGTRVAAYLPSGSVQAKLVSGFHPQIPQPLQEPIQRLQGLSSFAFQFTAGDSVFIPDIFHHLNQPALFGIEVAVQLVVGEVVELFQNQTTALFLSELATDGGENAVGFSEAYFEDGFVLVQGSDLLLVGFVAGIEVVELGVYLSYQFEALSLELVTSEPL